MCEIPMCYVGFENNTHEYKCGATPGECLCSGTEQALQAWHTKTKQADWKSTSDVKKDYRNASFVANN